MRRHLVALLTSFLCLLAAPLGAQDKVSYSGQIKPLLEAKCLACHGGAQQLSGLDLRTAAGMQKGGLHGPAVLAAYVAPAPFNRAFAAIAVLVLSTIVLRVRSS